MGKSRRKPDREPFNPRRARGADASEDAGLFGQPLDAPPSAASGESRRSAAANETASGNLPPSPPKAAAMPPGETTPANKTRGVDTSTSAPLTVSQVTRLIKGAINAAFSNTLHVVGELSNVSRGGAGGHLYFTLKDAASELRSVMWRTDASRVKFKLEDGMEVIASGTIEVYEPRGQVQFYIRRLEPRGVGALELAFRQLKERLQREGLFDPARKKPLPRLPRRIAVVTSPTGAALHDILTTLARRFPGVEVLVFGVRVQGEGAAAEIADAIARLNRSSADLGGIDVMIVGRGGGSLEDLWAFNEEVVARAIFASRIPVISAVGHEVDFTIADFVADLRAPTPTAAAEIVVPVRAELLTSVSDTAARLDRAASQYLERCRSRLALAERCEWFRDPISRIHQRGQQLDEAVSRLHLAKNRYLDARRSQVHRLEVRLTRVQPAAQLAARREALGATAHRLRLAIERLHRTRERRMRDAAARLAACGLQQVVARERSVARQVETRLAIGLTQLVERRRDALDAMEKRLLAASHESILRRGFSLTRRAADGKLIRTANDVRPADVVETQTAEGSFRSRVTEGKS